MKVKPTLSQPGCSHLCVLLCRWQDEETMEGWEVPHIELGRWAGRGRLLLRPGNKAAAVSWQKENFIIVEHSQVWLLGPTGALYAVMDTPSHFSIFTQPKATVSQVVNHNYFYTMTARTHSMFKLSRVLLCAGWRSFSGYIRVQGWYYHHFRFSN